MKIALDPYGRPFTTTCTSRLQSGRQLEREIAEMLGLVDRMLADGTITSEESKSLCEWHRSRPDVLGRWPVSLILSRLRQFFARERIDEAERADLRDLRDELADGRGSIVLGQPRLSRLPLDQPPPAICWGRGEVFVFAGRFAWGTRAQCQLEVHQRGSTCESNVTRRTSFVVVGTFGTEHWEHAVYGQQIQRALHLRRCGFPLRIVGEDHWVDALQRSERERSES